MSDCWSPSGWSPSRCWRCRCAGAAPDAQVRRLAAPVADRRLGVGSCSRCSSRRASAAADAGTVQLEVDAPGCPALGRALPPRRRRHLAAARPADRAARPPLPASTRCGSRPRPAGCARFVGLRAAARGRHARHVRRARPAAVLRVLRGRARPDVVRHRAGGATDDAAGRTAAATTFILYTLLGSRGDAARLPAGRARSRHVRHGRAGRRAAAPGMGRGTSRSSRSLALVLVGLAVKAPMWPLHTWLPDAHTARRRSARCCSPACC